MKIRGWLHGWHGRGGEDDTEIKRRRSNRVFRTSNRARIPRSFGSWGMFGISAAEGSRVCPASLILDGGTTIAGKLILISLRATIPARVTKRVCACMYVTSRDQRVFPRNNCCSGEHVLWRHVLAVYVTWSTISTPLCFFPEIRRFVMYVGCQCEGWLCMQSKSQKEIHTLKANLSGIFLNLSEAFY